MIEPNEIDRIKRSVAITDVLANRGVQPNHHSRDEVFYHSPFRDDANPSLSVNIRLNVFRDLAVKECQGDVIRLVMMLDNVGFATAVKTLQTFDGQTDKTPCFFLSGFSAASDTSASRDKIREVKLLSNPSLLRYVASRGISVGIARTYLREVHYTNQSRYLYAVGFGNDREGYFLRNGVGCKRNIGPSAITTVTGSRPDSRIANVFEGAFDFLSALEYYGQTIPTFPTYVLNSVSNLTSFIEQAGNYEQINTYFDHDRAGRDAFSVTKERGLPTFDRSELYASSSDFNAFLTAQNKRIAASSIDH